MIFGVKQQPQNVIRRFEFTSQIAKLTPEQRQANALEYIAYSLGRIDMHLEALAQAGAPAQCPAEPAGDE